MKPASLMSASQKELASVGGTQLSFSQMHLAASKLVDLDRPPQRDTRQPELFKATTASADAWRQSLGDAAFPKSQRSPGRTGRSGFGNTGGTAASHGAGNGNGAGGTATRLPRIRSASPHGGKRSEVAVPQQGPVAPADPTDNYAVQRADYMWQFIGRTEPAVQKPRPRREVVQMEERFDYTMRLCLEAAAAADTGIEPAGVRSNPVLAQDFMNMRARADEFVSSIHADSTSHLENAGCPITSAFRSGSDVTWLCGVLMVMQKWCDVTTGELEREVSLSCLEHGNLLHRLRAGACEVYGATMAAYTAFLQRTATMEDVIIAKQQELDVIKAEMVNHETRLEEVFNEKLAQSTKELTAERDAALDKAAETQAQNEKLSQTLSTLNGLFRSMKDDNDAVRIADLRDTCARLESRLNEKEAQLAQLTTVRSELQHQQSMARSYKSRSEALARELEETQDQLADRNALAQAVLQRESSRLAEIEYLTRAEGGGGKQSESEPPSRPPTRGDAPDPNVQMVEFGEEKQHWEYPMLCVRCSAKLNEMCDVEDDDDPKEEGRKHPVCMYYRVLLPMLGDTRPSRSAPWTFWCMRSIIMSKLTNDMIAEREGSTRPRFPEFVYCWFEGSGELEPTPASGTATPVQPGGVQRSNTLTNLDEAKDRNEARWAFYYCIRHLAREYPEAKLFYNFMDEKYGEDELTFYLYCLRVLDGHMSKPIGWGPTQYSSSYDAVPKQLNEFPPLDVQLKRRGERTEPINYPPVPMVPDKVWVGLTEATGAGETVLARANEEDRKASLWRLRGKALPAVGRLYHSGGSGSDNGAAAALRGIDGEDQVLADLVEHGQGNLVPGYDETKETKCVDLGTFLRIMLLEYREEQAHRRAALRLMFDTAVASIEAEREKFGGVRPGEANDEQAQRRARREAKKWEVPGGFEGTSVDFPQLRKIIYNVHSMCSVQEAAALYREAYTLGNGGVSYASFMQAAEKLQLFSACLRLPAAYGSDKKKPLTDSQASHLTSVVSKHYRTMDLDVLPFVTLTKNMPPIWSTRLKMAMFNVEQEIQDSGHGLKTDGRRSLVAYRRLIDLLSWIRLCNREIRGEDNGPLAVVRIDKELTALEGVVRRDMAGLNPSPSEIEHMQEVLRSFNVAIQDVAEAPQPGNSWMLLSMLSRTVCVVRIQRTFRSRMLPNAGVPWSMRKYMRRGYRPRTGPVGGGAPTLTGRIKSLRAVLSHIGAIYLEKLKGDAADVAKQRPRQQLPSFMYDYMLQLCGVRGVAEAHLHEFFEAVRRYQDSHRRVQLFALFTGIYKQGAVEGGKVQVVEDSMHNLHVTLRKQEAFVFFLKLLHRLQARSKQASKTENFLFPTTDPAKPVLVEATRTIAIVEKTLTALHDDAATATAVKDLTNMSEAGGIALDDVMFVCMTAWANNTVQRMQLFEEVYTHSTESEHELSLGEFSALIHKVDPERSQQDIVRVFREVTSRNSGSDDITLEMFMDICRRSDLLTASIPGELRVPNCTDRAGMTMWLSESWEVAKVEVQLAIDEIKDNPLEATEASLRLQQRASHFEAVLKLCNAAQAAADVVEQAWHSFRSLVADWTKHEITLRPPAYRRSAAPTPTANRSRATSMAVATNTAGTSTTGTSPMGAGAGAGSGAGSGTDSDSKK